METGGARPGRARRAARATSADSQPGPGRRHLRPCPCLQLRNALFRHIAAWRSSEPNAVSLGTGKSMCCSLLSADRAERRAVCRTPPALGGQRAMDPLPWPMTLLDGIDDWTCDEPYFHPPSPGGWTNGFWHHHVRAASSPGIDEEGRPI